LSKSKPGKLLLLEQRKTIQEQITKKGIRACETSENRSPAFFRTILSSTMRLDE
jgi:hypothetical protein